HLQPRPRHRAGDAAGARGGTGEAGARGDGVSRTAVVLFNLGGPDSLEAVRPFLFNLFNDPAIIRQPALLRSMIAAWIARRRTPTARHIYAQMGNRSPILPNTEAQARALEQVL